MIILSEDFQRFLDRSSRIVERALGESVDIYTDYTGTMDGEDGMYVENRNDKNFPSVFSHKIAQLLRTRYVLKNDFELKV